MLDPNVLEGSSSMPAAAIATTDPVPAKRGSAAPPSSEIGDLYVKHRSLLLHIACRKFRVPESDAEGLIQEVFVSLMTTTTKVENIRAWLVAATCNASRHYWRGQSRTESLPEDFDDHGDPRSQGIADRFAMSITMRQALEYLQDRCRETLYLHYYEGRSAPDVARELETTTRYAEKLIHNCLKRVREIYFNITAVKR
ncbi:MAG: sigma-70 family RNA polymerase sigma factor [Thermoanaerobaculia bacterium]